MLAALGLGKVQMKRGDAREVQRYRQSMSHMLFGSDPNLSQSLAFSTCSKEHKQSVPCHLPPTHPSIKAANSVTRTEAVPAGLWRGNLVLVLEEAVTILPLPSE